MNVTLTHSDFADPYFGGSEIRVLICEFCDFRIAIARESVCIRNTNGELFAISRFLEFCRVEVVICNGCLDTGETSDAELSAHVAVGVIQEKPSYAKNLFWRSPDGSSNFLSDVAQRTILEMHDTENNEPVVMSVNELDSGLILYCEMEGDLVAAELDPVMQ